MAKAKEKRTYSNDEIRQRILNYLDHKRKTARGVSGLAASISEINKTLRVDGIKQNEVASNLDYLVQHGWVKEEVINRPYTTRRGFQVPSEKRLYKLSDIGIKYTEGHSIFDRSDAFSGINITNIGGVTVVGSNNVVRNEFIDILRVLNQLEGMMKVSDQLLDEQKLNIQSDIQTIKAQLSKTNPDKSILQKAIEGISFIGSLPGFAEVLKILKTAIDKIF